MTWNAGYLPRIRQLPVNRLKLADPGVANWLDPAGFAEGYLFLRWQGLAQGPGADEAPSAELTPLAELDRRLPEGTRRVSARQRAAQLAQRLMAPLRK